MQVSLIGGLTGALLCAAGRGLVVAANLGTLNPVFILPSAGIGLLVGALVGATGRPLLAAACGAFLSAIIFEFFMMPCAALLGVVGDVTGHAQLAPGFLRHTLLYCLEMGIAGAVGGGVGAIVGRRDLARSRRSAHAAEVGGVHKRDGQ